MNTKNNKPFSIIRNILAILGGLTIVALIVIWIISPNYDVEIYKNNIGLYKNRLNALRSSGNYAADTTVFSMQIIQDSARAKEIRDYFQLDTLFPNTTKGNGRNMSTPLDCGNTRKRSLQLSTAAFMAS